MATAATALIDGNLLNDVLNLNVEKKKILAVLDSRRSPDSIHKMVLKEINK